MNLTRVNFPMISWKYDKCLCKACVKINISNPKWIQTVDRTIESNPIKQEQQKRVHGPKISQAPGIYWLQIEHYHHLTRFSLVLNPA